MTQRQCVICIRKELSGDDTADARLSRLQQEVGELLGFAERCELVEDEQRVTRLSPGDAVSGDLLDVLCDDASHQLYVLGPLQRREADVRYRVTSERCVEVE